MTTVAVASRPTATTAADAAGRDGFVDAVRVLAIGGVVIGHWLVTGLVLSPVGDLRISSPLTTLPGFTPASWVLQTLGLLFFAGGFGAARSRLRARRSPAVRRRSRLLRPVLALLGMWAGALTVAATAGVSEVTIRTVSSLVLSPLWFLAPYLALGTLTPVLLRLVDRYGAAPIVGAAVAVTAVADLAPLPTGVAYPIAALAAWAVPWLLGIAAATRRLGVPAGRWLFAGGVVAVAGLVLVAGYPAAAVGVPGGARSNLAPPGLYAVALAVAQIGAVLLARPLLDRLGRRSRRAVTAVTTSAVPIYLWHQSVLIVLVAVTVRLAPGPLPGLHTAPDDVGWVLWRAGWVLALAGLLWAGVRPWSGKRRDHA